MVVVKREREDGCEFRRSFEERRMLMTRVIKKKGNLKKAKKRIKNK